MNEHTESKYIRDGRAPIPKSEVTSRVMSANRAKNTKPEIMLRKALWHKCLRGYRLDWKNVPGRRDISYPGRRVAVFVHGCFWHKCPKCNLPLPKSNTDYWREKFERNKARDKMKELKLRDAGWTVITIWECEIKQDVNHCIGRIEEALMRE